MSREIMQQALDALIFAENFTKGVIDNSEEINAIRKELRYNGANEKLAQPANEFHPDWDTLKPYHDRIAELEAQLAKPEIKTIDPCPQCQRGGVCRTPKCGRLQLPVDHPYRNQAYALAQPEQEPVAWSVLDKRTGRHWYTHESKYTAQYYSNLYSHRESDGSPSMVVIPLYTAPQTKQEPVERKTLIECIAGAISNHMTVGLYPKELLSAAEYIADNYAAPPIPNVSTKQQNVNTSEERVHKSDKSIHEMQRLGQELEQEPVAWVTRRTGDGGVVLSGYETCEPTDYDATPVYTAPPSTSGYAKKIESLIKERDELRKALAQPEQEPVAYVEKGALYWCDDTSVYDAEKLDGSGLYTSPPKREWVGLTDEEMMEPWPFETRIEFVRWIESKLREKNNG